MSDSDPGSVTLWIQRLQGGDRDAFQQIWERFFQRMVRQVRAKLHGVSRTAMDEEDVASVAFTSFFLAMESGRFPRIADRHDLWTVLMLIATRKVYDLIEHEQRIKRDWRRALPSQPGSESSDLSAQPYLVGLISKEPDPAFAVEMMDCCRQLLDALGDRQLKEIALWKLEGYTNEEIGSKLDCALATVERRLVLIREIWWDKMETAGSV
jgi:DNA-directed RNA polymerase specialized sigma24 family protein